MCLPAGYTFSENGLARHGVIGEQNNNGRNKQRYKNDRAPERLVPYRLHKAIHRKLAATTKFDAPEQFSVQPVSQTFSGPPVVPD